MRIIGMIVLAAFLNRHFSVAEFPPLGLAGRMTAYVVGVLAFSGLIMFAVSAIYPLTVMMLVVTCVGLATVAVPFTLVISQYVVRPVRDMTDAAQVAMTGDFSRQMDLPRNDELGELAKAFDCITRHMEDNARSLQRLTLIDSLTNLPNRDALRQYIDFALLRKMPCGLLLLDVARLARINEALGSEVGDQVLVHVAQRLTRIVCDHLSNSANVKVIAGELAGEPDLDTVSIGRLSGDQFGIIMLGHVDEVSARELARKLTGGFHEPFQIEGHIFSLSCRIGVALAPKDALDFSMLVNSASASLAEAKRSGRSIHRTEREDSRGKAYNELIVEQELRHALKNNELQVYYQPQVALSDGNILGAEALIRWMHPTRGLLAPAHFIDLAEQAGLLNAIGDYVLRAICAQSVLWGQSGFHPKLSMNVSASHCQSENFAQDVLSIVRETHALPNLLELEITETVAMQDAERTARDLAPLREAGLRLAVDDFGTGYSNLASLSRLPFDVLKIDRGFVMDSDHAGTSRLMVATILAMARNLGFETVAEGVETEAQRDFLIQQGCTVAQGYLFGKPMPVDDFTHFYIKSSQKAVRDLQEFLERQNRSLPDAGTLVRH
jgi:predicted signal transduction protein with EAL and GGDEF domain